jgi:hypothetical protein
MWLNFNINIHVFALKQLQINIEIVTFNWHDDNFFIWTKISLSPHEDWICVRSTLNNGLFCLDQNGQSFWMHGVHSSVSFSENNIFSWQRLWSSSLKFDHKETEFTPVNYMEKTRTVFWSQSAAILFVWRMQESEE